MWSVLQKIIVVGLAAQRGRSLSSMQDFWKFTFA